MWIWHANITSSTSFKSPRLHIAFSHLFHVPKRPQVSNTTLCACYLHTIVLHLQHRKAWVAHMTLMLADAKLALIEFQNKLRQSHQVLWPISNQVFSCTDEGEYGVSVLWLIKKSHLCTWQINIYIKWSGSDQVVKHFVWPYISRCQHW